jgi:nucleoside-diphosphate-sugar epimerase
VGAKRILVLGSTGRVGRLLRLAWARSAPKDTELLLQSRGSEGITWAPGQPNAFGAVDAVISLWGVTQGDETVLSMNPDLALEAQKIAAECGAQRVLHCSSVAVYSPAKRALIEGDETLPANAYGQAKLRMEQAVLAADADGPPATCLRIGSVAGAESLANSMRQSWQGEASVVTLDRFPDGKGPARSYVAPSDLAHIVLALACHSQTVPGVLNVGAPQPVFMEDLLDAANHPMQWRAAPSGARQCAVMSCQRLQGLVDLPANMSDPEHIVHDWLKLEGRL